MMINKTYYIPNCQLNIQTSDTFIYNSINYYFSIYNNIKFRSSKKFGTINLKINSNDENNELTNLLKIVKLQNTPNFFVNSRFEIYRLSDFEYLITFYKDTCIAKINLLNKNIECYFDEPTKFGIDFIPNFIVIALIEILFKFENRFFIHSSAIEKNKKAVIIAGHSGSGKTTLAFYLMLNKYKLLTDDKAFVWWQNNKIKISGLLQPTDIIKSKDKFLINTNIIENIADKMTEDAKRFIITSFQSKKISDTAEPHILLFPQVSTKFKIEELPKKQALLKLISTSITPNFNIHLKEHFDILNKIVENSYAYNILLDKNLDNVLKFLDNIN